MSPSGKEHYNGKKTHCKNGHPFTPENTRINGIGSRVCLQCAKDYYKSTIKPKVQANPTRYRESLRKSRVSRYGSQGEYSWQSRLVLFGMTEHDFNLLHSKQGGVCAICGGSNHNRRLAVDHNHTTGEVRGLLCCKCNAGIGMLKDSPEIIKKALEYVENSKTGFFSKPQANRNESTSGTIMMPGGPNGEMRRYRVEQLI